MSENEYNQVFADNPGFADQMDGYLLDIGQKRDPSRTHYETLNPKSGSSSLVDDIASSQYFTPQKDSSDGGEEGYQTMASDTGETGGSTYFKSSTANPTKDDVKNKKILLQAIENMREGEGSSWYNSQLDKMWLTQKGDKWQLEENDPWFAGGNETRDVRVSSDTGLPEVKVNGEWLPINADSGKHW